MERSKVSFEDLRLMEVERRHPFERTASHLQQRLIISSPEPCFEDLSGPVYWRIAAGVYSGI